MLRCLALLLLLGGIFFYLLLPKPLLLQGIPFSRAVYDQQQHLLRMTLASDGQYRLFVPLKNISSLVKKATLLQEDRYFYYHPGVNPWALLKALWQTVVIRHRRYGASTITMQLARIRFHLNTHTVIGKLKQIYLALQFERHYSKAKILQAYLNLVPYGGNVSGIGAASLIYFHQAARSLSLSESLTLSVIPQNPRKRRPRNITNTALQKARGELFQRWQQYYPVKHSEKIIVNLPMQTYNIKQLPFLAPHFVNNVLRRYPHQQVINTTLDSVLQHQLTANSKHYLEQQHGINNAAAILVDTRTLSVVALVGSGGFFNHQIQGQIDGTAINRSPGSTLKPFIYALGIEQGLITPKTILNDAPEDFSSYDPENFDHQFLGPISAQQALVMSRNIPAVHLLQQLKRPDLYTLLKQIHVDALQPRGSYGLSLALGSGEISLQKLVSLYAMLANQGQWQPLRWTTTNLPIAKRLLTPEAAFITLAMLTHNPIPNALPAFTHLAQQLPIAWKTGTSSGYRDAWSVGVFGHYVLGVWLGNFNDHRQPGLVGRQLAAPLFFRIANTVIGQQHLQRTQGLSPKYLNVKRMAVCEASGELMTPLCPKSVNTWYIPGVSPIKKDTVYRQVAINPKTGLRTCQINKNTVFKTYEFWSSNLLALFRQAGIPRQSAPAFEKGCQVTRGEAPEITSPLQDVNYLIGKKQQQIPLIATVDAGVKTLYWFVEQTYIGKSPPNKPLLWKAIAGRFLLRVVDDKGRADVRVVNVREIR